MAKVIFSALVLGFLAVVSQGPVEADQLRGFPLAQVNGDVNADKFTDLSDAIYLVRFLYLGGPEPAVLGCEPFNHVKNGDIDGSGSYEITDPIRLINFLFMGGPPPVEACD
jgi:hypothetical protein